MEAMALVRAHSRSKAGAERMVMLCLAYYAGRETLLAWPSDREIAEWTGGLSKSSIARALRALVDLGEIRPQPRRPGGPRRTYLVDPRGGAQLSLLGTQTGHHDTFALPNDTFVAPAEGVMVTSEGATHARAGKNRLNPQPKTPPTPLKGGARTPGISEQRSRPEPQRRSRRRRRTAEPVIRECCPAGENTTERDRLSQAWAQIAARLSEQIGESMVEIWFGSAHVHERGGGRTVLALPPQTAAWSRDRFHAALVRAARGPVEFVACSSLQAVST